MFVPQMQAIDEDEGVAAVKEAFDLGINFFDTSPYYGDTKSEAVRRPWRLLSGGAGATAAAPTAVDVQPFSQLDIISLAPVTWHCALRSTQVLGRGLAQLPRDQIVVATKVGRYGANTFDFRWAHVINWEPPALLSFRGLPGWSMTTCSCVQKPAACWEPGPSPTLPRLTRSQPLNAAPPQCAAPSA